MRHPDKNKFLYRLCRSVLVCWMLGLAQWAWALTPFNLRDIRVEGLQRVEPGTVFASLPFRIGETYTDEKGSAAIRALFALGLFKDVRIEAQDNVLIVVVQERPIIAAVDFIGMREFEKDTIKKALRDIGLTEDRPFDRALADRAEQELKRQYVSRSLYAAQVVTTVTPLERNRVNLSFNVVEGDVARINEIKIHGAQAFSESTLLRQFDLDTGGTMSWYTKSDRYSRAKLNGDIENLRAYYLNRGYLEFRLDSTQVNISPDKQSIGIGLYITEGQRYVVSGVKLEGNFLGKEEAFKTLVKIEPGEAYNAERVSETVKAFQDFYGVFGYAFARVEIKPVIDRENARVAFVIQGTPAQRVYVRKINVVGNANTRDEVVRREFRQYESAWYDSDKIKLSRDRVDRLGYFKDVQIDTQEIPGSLDQIDITISVTEKPTGNLNLGAGFSSATNLSLIFGIRQDNAFGSGQSIGFDLNTSKYNQTMVINTTNPYFTQDGVSRTFDYYQRATIPYSSIGGDYRIATQGTSVRFGIPITESDRIFIGQAYESTKLTSGTNMPAAYLAYLNEFGSPAVGYPLSIGWARDSRDSGLAPTRGRLVRLNADVSWAGDVHYFRSTSQYQHYIPLNKQFTIALNGELGYGKGLDGRSYPVFKNFFSGGLGSVRGFDQGTIGPRDVTGSYIGGTKKITLNAELLAPFPGTGNDKTLRMYAFYDMGNVYAETEDFDASRLRSSYGIGISWISPMGPLRLAYGNPITKFTGDRINHVQFQIGTAF
jgi:outer membrane protein insertion porin family